MTQYLLTVHHDYAAAPAANVEELYAAVDAFNQSITDIEVFGGGLEAPDTATVVASRDGQLVMTDGPYLDTKEVIGGFWVIEVPDLDAALEVAGRATVACQAPVEVRPFQAE